MNHIINGQEYRDATPEESRFVGLSANNFDLAIGRPRRFRKNEDGTMDSFQYGQFGYDEAPLEEAILMPVEPETPTIQLP